MKCSMSMSSLSPSNKVLRTPESSKMSVNYRHCHSLSSKKSRRALEKKFHRRSWGSAEEMSQDELWKFCFQAVQGTSSTLAGKHDDVREFLEDYSRISDWLNSMQARRSQLADSAVLCQLSDDMERNQHVQQEMNERGRILAENLPNLKEEFQWRMKHMNSQWNSLEKILLCQSSGRNKENQRSSNSSNEDCDVHWVSRWLRQMEEELQPLAFNVQWAPDCLQKELRRHQDLQSEIESKAAVVHSALRNSRSQGRISKKRIDVVERRWIQLRLRILEWVEHLSRVQQKETSKTNGRAGLVDSNGVLSDDDTNEPLSKYARLGSFSSLAESDFAEESEIAATNGANKLQNSSLSECKTPKSGRQQLLLDQQEQVMGQSHEVGSVYESGSAVTNCSVIELSFDGVSSSGDSVGVKRKVSPGITELLSSPQVVPSMQMNISTYYFKHSDTEAEGSQLHEQRNQHNAGEELSCCKNGNVRSWESGTLKSSSVCAPREDGFLFARKSECQRNVDGCQQDLNMNPIGEFEFGSSLSSDLVFDFSKELEEMDQEEEALKNLNEIEELVEKAEYLVKVGRKRQRAATGGTFRLDLDSWGLSELDRSLFSSQFKDHSSPLLQKYPKSNEKENAEGQNKKCPCQLNPEEVGAVGGFCLCASTSTVTPNPAPKVPKRHSRVRQWVRAHNTSILKEQKSTSSCDASGESASESESDVSDGSNDEPQLSSDDPTILTASTTLLLQQTQQSQSTSRGITTSNSPKRGSSFTSLRSADHPSRFQNDSVVFRSKKAEGEKQRPKSFTDNSNVNFVSGGLGLERFRFGNALSPIHDFTQKVPVFASDSALNALETNSNSESEPESPEDPFAAIDASTLRDRRKGKFRKRLSKQKKRESLDVDLEEDELDQFTSNSVLANGFAEMEHQLDDIESALPSTPTLRPNFKLDQADNGSLVTDLPTNDQDWDSYQEKYLSEPYSEEPFDADRTLKLLAFGEDYDQVLDRAESESSSLLSGCQFPESNPRKRRSLTFLTRNEMAETDSDREEFNHFLVQSIAQLRFIDSVFRKQIESSSFHVPDSPSEYAEMEATCEENMNSLKLILCNVEKPDALPFDIDIKSIQDVLNSWDLLRGRITNAAKLKQMYDDLKYLRVNFESIQRDLSLVDPYDSKDLSSLKIKIDRIQSLVNELTSKRRKLQSVNEDSVGTQIYLKEASVDVRKQLRNLYALYEENFQLGSYLLDKMKFLEEAWTNFEQERDAFEKSLAVTPAVHLKGKKSLSSGASTDSGHGTDFSFSDSDIDEKRQKLVALRNKALDLKAFLPVGSPVLDVIDSKISEAQKDFEMIEKVGTAPLNLKLIFPKRKSPVSIRKSNHRSSKSPPSRTTRSVSRLRSASPASKPSLKRDSSRHWRTLRFSLTFHLALMGLFAVAWFLQPRCCENMNTFSFSLVPHLAHDRVPHI